MAWILVGLGNPGAEYQRTRHNTGRMALEYLAKRGEFYDWKVDKTSKSTIARGTVGDAATIIVLPDTFMNKSGSAVVKYVKSVKAAERMIVLYDDLDLPLGVIKISFDRGSGGHKGLESIMRTVKTKKFARVRIGISRATPSGKMKKPSGEKEVLNFILEKFKPQEMEELSKIFKRTEEAVEKIIAEGAPSAMNSFN